MDRTLFADISGLTRGPADPINEQAPLIVAIHGGTYTSGYFDVPGYSLLERAAINGLKAIAIDRPSYGTTPSLDPGDMAIDGQARYLARALDEAWRVYGESTRGIVLIGHSIGAAIAATIASEPSGLPVLGLAISGVGLRTPGTHGPLWQSLPDTPTVEMPAHIKDQLMFGPAGSFDPAMPSASCPTAALMAATSPATSGVGTGACTRTVLSRERALPPARIKLVRAIRATDSGPIASRRSMLTSIVTSETELMAPFSP